MHERTTRRPGCRPRPGGSGGLPSMNPANNLDFIRSFLALGVLSLHTLGAVGVTYPQLPWVPAFIAISGFLITESMERSRGYGHFAWKRILRVGPAFCLSLALVHALGGSISDALIDWATMGLDYRGSNPPLWSLSLEEVLYFLLALWFAMGVYQTRRRALLVLVTLFCVGLISANFVPVRAMPIYVVTLTFLCGTALYVARDRIKWVPLLGVLSLAVAFGLRNAGLGKGSVIYAALIGPAISYAVIVLAFHTKPVFSRYKQFIGDPSLGIYVYHYPILHWLQGQGIGSPWLFPATLALTALAALASWHAVEKHALKLKDWRPRHRPDPGFQENGAQRSR